MTRFVGTPLRGTEFANAGDEAVSARVASDSYPRIRIDAGGRITWASGSATGDTTLYRDAANLLKTDDAFQALSGVITLTTSGAPTAALADGALAVDTTNNAFYYRSGGSWIQVTVEVALNDLTDVTITSPLINQSLVYNGTEWTNQYAPVTTYARNAEATSLAVGEVVYLFGAAGDRASVKRASNSSEATSSKTVGVVEVGGASGSDVAIVTQGYVSGINLGAYTAGDVLWLGSTPGTFTTTKPVAPNHLVFIGVVARANSGNGILYVKCQNGYEINELHDVKVTSPTAGQVLKYNGTIWVNDTDSTGTSINALDDIGDVVLTSVTSGQVLSYNGTNWVNSVVTSYTNIDGGLASSDYTAVAAIDGGSA